MYERFTDRARRAMLLANQEAVRHGHEYLGVEHIFCGLLSERGGVAASALKSLSVDFDAMLSAVRGTMSETNQITTGKLPQTPNAKILIHRSIEIAKDAGHNYIGTEHLFLSLIRVCENSRPELYAILKSHKATQEFFWLSVIDTLKSVEADPQGVFTQTTDSVLEQWNFQLALGSECQVSSVSVDGSQFRSAVLNILAEELEAAKRNGHLAAGAYLKRVMDRIDDQGKTERGI
jgi:ATP-dependent Clp protease ATP-binding subunit ClpC